MARITNPCVVALYGVGSLSLSLSLCLFLSLSLSCIEWERSASIARRPSCLSALRSQHAQAVICASWLGKAAKQFHLRANDALVRPIAVRCTNVCVQFVSSIFACFSVVCLSNTAAYSIWARYGNRNTYHRETGKYHGLKLYATIRMPSSTLWKYINMYFPCIRTIVL